MTRPVLTDFAIIAFYMCVRPSRSHLERSWARHSGLGFVRLHEPRMDMALRQRVVDSLPEWLILNT
jgi:hypothetical protein